MYGVHDDAGPLGRVREGMRVVDVDGRDCGTVGAVRMGDLEAASTDGQLDGDSGLIHDLGQALGASDSTPEQTRERFLRTGFLRLDRGLLARDLSVAGDMVDRVDGDTVHLSVPIDR